MCWCVCWWIWNERLWWTNRWSPAWSCVRVCSVIYSITLSSFLWHSSLHNRHTEPQISPQQRSSSFHLVSLSHWLWCFCPYRWLHRKLHSPAQTHQQYTYIQAFLLQNTLEQKLAQKVHLLCFILPVASVLHLPSVVQVNTKVSVSLHHLHMFSNYSKSSCWSCGTKWYTTSVRNHDPHNAGWFVQMRLGSLEQVDVYTQMVSKLWWVLKSACLLRWINNSPSRMWDVRTTVPQWLALPNAF